VLCELVKVDMERRRDAGEPVQAEYYLRRYPELAPHLDLAQTKGAPQEKPATAAPTALPQHIGRYRVGPVEAGAVLGQRLAVNQVAQESLHGDLRIGCGCTACRRG
jgi:hypothetical protein